MPCVLAIGLVAGCGGPRTGAGCDAACAPGYDCVDERCVPGDGGSFSDGGGGHALDGWACGGVDFALTETQEVFRVPADVSYLHVKAWGSGGNGEGCDGVGGRNGGPGGFAEAVFPVSPGDALIVIVGHPGSALVDVQQDMRFGFGRGGGGGLSGVFRGSELLTADSHDRALVIAGGGGGATAYREHGGWCNANNPCDDPAFTCNLETNRCLGAMLCPPGGPGNHPQAGGMPDMQGGAGAGDDAVNGGGGGHRGGPGGDVESGGTGGTGFVDDARATGAFLQLYGEPNSNTPPRTDDPDWQARKDASGAGPGMTEMPGLVVLDFTCEPYVVQ